MKRLITHQVTFRGGIAFVAAMIVLALLSASARRVGVVAFAATVVGMASTPLAAAENRDTTIRPFKVKVPEADLAELRRRIGATKWPEPELVPDASQGVQFATMQKLAHYWAAEYDWRKFEARLNALPQRCHRSAHESDCHGGSAEEAFDVVVPSLPGYGFSGEPTALGWRFRPHRPRVGAADAAPRSKE